MKVNEQEYRSIWYSNNSIKIIDQSLLPFKFKILELKTIKDVIKAIKELKIRGAPALGIIGAYAMVLSYLKNKGNLKKIEKDFNTLINSRPTAINLKTGALYIFNFFNEHKNISEKFITEKANEFYELEIEKCKKIGFNGLELIKNFFNKEKRLINILVHCNAGWLACGDYGTALSPIYLANKENIPLHIWVTETRPLNQGARLTSFELFNEKINFTIIPDSLAGFLMFNKLVDYVFIGADRILKNGDVYNKVGSYSLSICAKENKIPFIVFAPSSSFDIQTSKRKTEIIEIRKPNELREIQGLYKNNLVKVKIIPNKFPSLNYAFDIVLAENITYYITENGIFKNIKEIIDSWK